MWRIFSHGVIAKFKVCIKFFLGLCHSAPTVSFLTLKSALLFILWKPEPELLTYRSFQGCIERLYQVALQICYKIWNWVLPILDYLLCPSKLRFFLLLGLFSAFPGRPLRDRCPKKNNYTYWIFSNIFTNHVLLVEL